MSKMTILETVTGKMVNIAEPDPNDICIDDIAWGLSRIPRFCGMTITEVPYNVAQHSVFVGREVEKILGNPEAYPELKTIHGEIRELAAKQYGVCETVMLATLHDASEVYTGDIPSPVKQIPELRAIVKKVEHDLMTAVYYHFKLLPPTELQEQIIKHADKIAQKIEAHAFMQSRGNHWPNMPTVSLERLQKFESPKKALESYNEFLDFFNRYREIYKGNKVTW